MLQDALGIVKIQFTGLWECSRMLLGYPKRCCVTIEEVCLPLLTKELQWQALFQKKYFLLWYISFLQLQESLCSTGNNYYLNENFCSKQTSNRIYHKVCYWYKVIVFALFVVK